MQMAISTRTSSTSNAAHKCQPSDWNAAGPANERLVRWIRAFVFVRRAEVHEGRTHGLCGVRTRTCNDGPVARCEKPNMNEPGCLGLASNVLGSRLVRTPCSSMRT